MHNANLAVGFLNAELDRLAKSPLRPDRIVDTLALARRRHPAGPNSLDALCKRYGIDNSERTKHGALVDSLLLAGVYVELLGERQATLGLGSQSAAETRTRLQTRAAKPRAAPLPARLPAQAPAAAGSAKRTGASRASRVRQDPGAGRAVAALSGCPARLNSVSST